MMNLFSHNFWRTSSLIILSSILLFSCEKKSEPVKFTILQLNDVYEITPIYSGKYGGLARVAAVRKQLLRENPNLLTMLSGDFISPSAIGPIMHNGHKISGLQMIDALNVMGLDYATFGNHEFDVFEDELMRAIQASTFEWIATNTFYKVNGQVRPFYKVIGSDTIDFKKSAQKVFYSANKTDSVRLSVLGITIPYNKKPFNHYTDIFEATQEELINLQGKSDVVVSMTHLYLAQDKEYARRFPEIPLLLGGHDHDNSIDSIGPVRITKADANAKTVYVHRCTYDPVSKKVSIESELVPINEDSPIDAETQAVVDKWMQIAKVEMEKSGLDPTRKIAVLKEPLEARESKVRHEPTNSGAMLCESVLSAFGSHAEGVLIGSGMIRIDEILEGEITEFDVLRLLPFGGGVYLIDIDGAALIKALDAGEENKGTGGYLQRKNFSKNEKGEWLLNNALIQQKKSYKIAVNDYLITGKEVNLGFMQNYKGIDLQGKKYQDIADQPFNDIRKILINYITKDAEK